MRTDREDEMGDLAVLLWVGAALFASFLLTWWFFDRLYA
jgi:hypothetical protein